MSKTPPLAVTLTRNQIVWILEHYMGWEPEDTRSFWRLAKMEHADPGCLHRERKAYVERQLRRVRAKSSAT